MFYLDEFGINHNTITSAFKSVITVSEDSMLETTKKYEEGQLTPQPYGDIVSVKTPVFTQTPMDKASFSPHPKKEGFYTYKQIKLTFGSPLKTATIVGQDAQDFAANLAEYQETVLKEKGIPEESLQYKNRFTAIFPDPV